MKRVAEEYPLGRVAIARHQEAGPFDVRKRAFNGVFHKRGIRNTKHEQMFVRRLHLVG